ncbi:hypothetical protein GCM10022286_17970 [Gryllotalpicola daejeonensis]|uniref:Uncharacterized protein n=1 Tax=Gryllotalpicola daejeonensis TaxID=993087 RepID=A0ABP7ZK21_9MICO
MASATASSRPRAVRWAVRIGLLVLAALVVFAVVRTMHDLNLAAIGVALGRLRWWEVVALIGVLVLRQVLSAVPLTIYIPGVSLGRAVATDLTALTTAAFASAPGKIAARVAIFSSTGTATGSALAGSVLNTLTMFVARFGVPLFGFVLVFVTGAYRPAQFVDLASLLFAAVLVIGMLMVASAEDTAVRLGGWAGRTARRFRARVDPAHWASSFGRFQQDVAGDLPRRLPRAAAVLAVMLLVELALLLLAFRFVGVTPSDAGTLAIATIFFFAYPLTMFPLQGAGVVDVAILLSLFGSGGGTAVDAATAALLIWRALTVVGPYALAAVAVAIWRAVTRRA